jgi:hypothetical protein
MLKSNALWWIAYAGAAGFCANGIVVTESTADISNA